ncbi:MAG: sulfotransferase [Myxococcota bacterium]
MTKASSSSTAARSASTGGRPMLSAPRVRRPVRAINAVLSALGPLTPLGRSLRADDLLELAAEKAGLSDFGSPTYRAGLDRLLRALDQEANLTPIGRLIAREEILGALTSRLQVLDHHRRFREIGEGRIEAPVIMIGMGRSGTTILHELMALDPRNRTPATWEVDMPFPPPETATHQSDPRIAEIQQRLDRTDQILPDFKKIHRMGATLPQECVRWTTGEFASLIFGISYEVPSYGQWLIDDVDYGPVYAYHKQFLQLLQWKCPAERWVLKSPAHLWSLQAMLEAYPDARLVQTHRDPLKTTASLASLVTNLRVMSSNQVDPRAVGRQWANWNASALNASVDARESGLITGDRIIDISFYDFMSSPLEQVAIIYDFLGFELTTEVEGEMRRYLEVHTAQQHGAHQYRFEDFGLDLAEERARFERYQSYFHVPNELDSSGPPG